MIVENLVPEVYYKESRDFAYAGRVFEVLFNYMKTAAACVNVNYNVDSTSASIIDLLTDSLGFTAKHPYDIKNLVAIINSFQSLLRLKGSILAIETAIKILMNAQEILPLDTKDLCEIDSEDEFLLNIYLPENLSDIVLLEDLFDYLLPAGMYYCINKVGKGSGTVTSNTDSNMEITHREISDKNLSNILSEKRDSDKNYSVTSDLVINTVSTGMVDSN